VQVILKIVTSLQARFAVRSIGHNPNVGFSSIGEDGVLLDLSELNNITLSPPKDVVSVGPGATWGKVYENIEKHHLTVVGGRVTDVGVGGLILGGVSNFSLPPRIHDHLLLDCLTLLNVALSSSYKSVLTSLQVECLTSQIGGEWLATMSRTSK
jgi:hypothetical protein